MSNGTLLIVEDDTVLAKALERSFQRRSYDVIVCNDHSGMTEVIRDTTPDFAVVDLKLSGANGLDCVKALHAHDPAMRIVVLTGFASITTAVEAIKLGACNYLAKPANTDDIIKALQNPEGSTTVPLASRRTSLKNLEWERIHETLVDTDFNISEAARRLGLHRRTLARKLEKRRIT